jgi:hypothetical protein
MTRGKYVSKQWWKTMWSQNVRIHDSIVGGKQHEETTKRQLRCDDVEEGVAVVVQARQFRRSG